MAPEIDMKLGERIICPFMNGIIPVPVPGSKLSPNQPPQVVPAVIANDCLQKNCMLFDTKNMACSLKSGPELIAQALGAIAKELSVRNQQSD